MRESTQLTFNGHTEAQAVGARFASAGPQPNNAEVTSRRRQAEP